MGFYEVVNIYTRMKNRGVVIYGAGKMGELAINVLEKEKIKIHAVADKNKKEVLGYKCIELKDITQYSKNIVCILTPKNGCEIEKEILKDYFDDVIDMYIIHLIKYCMMPLQFEQCYPFNHYESPYLSINEIDGIQDENIGSDVLIGVDLNFINQNHFKEIICNKYNLYNQFLNIPYHRYSIENAWFNKEDALVLMTMMLEFKPKKIIEIGSGFSTCVMLDVNEYCLNNETEITSIEPYPERLLSKIRINEKNYQLNVNSVQQCDISIFEKLEKNDILFIDSSHVAKSGGDILYEYFKIIPMLQSGVIIHIHDIFFPFTYPKKWLYEGRCYNEAYILHGFLMNNNEYEIIYFNNFMHSNLVESIGESFESGGSIWIRKK
jgi:predicted O-methyltransferase YrrM